MACIFASFIIQWFSKSVLTCIVYIICNSLIVMPSIECRVLVICVNTIYECTVYIQYNLCRYLAVIVMMFR